MCSFSRPVSRVALVDSAQTALGADSIPSYYPIIIMTEDHRRDTMIKLRWKQIISAGLAACLAVCFLPQLGRAGQAAETTVLVQETAALEERFDVAEGRTIEDAADATLATFYSDTITSATDSRIASMLSAIGNQTFPAGISASTVKGQLQYFITGGPWAAIGGGKFPYPNNSGVYYENITDGVYTKTVRGTGCFAYEKFVSLVIYSTDGAKKMEGEAAGRMTAAGLKAFLQAQAQAGEHLRVDGKHSALFISCNDQGLYYLDYRTDTNPYITLSYATYANFANKCNEVGKQVWLYNVNTAQNSDGPVAPETYTVQFDPAGGTVWPMAKIVTYGSAVGEMPKPSRTGHAFNCWYFEQGGIRYKVEPTTLYNLHRDCTFKALWDVQTTPVDEPSSWAAAEVQAARNLGLIPGEMQAKYTTNITRGEFCKLIINMLERVSGRQIEDLLAEGGLSPSPTTFTDTSDSDILAAYAMGIVRGIGDKRFNPGGSITRQEAAVMLMRSYYGPDVDNAEGIPPVYYTDGDQIASWGKNGVYLASVMKDPQSGTPVMQGLGGGVFAPRGTYTREQAYLTILRLYRFLTEG